MKTARVPHRWAEHKELAALIRKTTRKYVKLFGLEKWDIHLGWVEIADDKAAQCTAEPEYYKAVIEYDLVSLAKRPEDADAYVRHEMLHILLWPLAEAVQLLTTKKAEAYLLKIEERIVSDLERLPLWGYVE